MAREHRAAAAVPVTGLCPLEAAGASDQLCVMLKPIFLSHGAPTLPIENAEVGDFLRSLGKGERERPKAILVVSAHWETDVPTVNAVAVNDTIHDFSGFPPELYRLSYPAPGSPELAERVATLLRAAGLPVAVDGRRGLDHGAWVPLLLAWPRHDIPVVQLSVQPGLSPAHHLRLGGALAPLTREGVQIIASGSFTHDLSSFRGDLPDNEPEWVSNFAEWMDEALTEGRTADLTDYEERAPNARRNHPTPEHLLPLFVALGAAGHGAKGQRLHRSLTHGVLRMDAYAFA